MKIKLIIISFVFIILTLFEQFATQKTASNTINTYSTSDITKSIPYPHVVPVKRETDPYKVYLCDEQNSRSISIVNLF